MFASLGMKLKLMVFNRSEETAISWSIPCNSDDFGPITMDQISCCESDMIWRLVKPSSDALLIALRIAKASVAKADPTYSIAFDPSAMTIFWDDSIIHPIPTDLVSPLQAPSVNTLTDPVHMFSPAVCIHGDCPLKRDTLILWSIRLTLLVSKLVYLLHLDDLVECRVSPLRSQRLTGSLKHDMDYGAKDIHFPSSKLLWKSKDLLRRFAAFDTGLTEKHRVVCKP
ncbi:hypothetical protein AALP_AA6G093500 [Arabis alpina]|uniref:Uncharacterized protein n=1 Tax=Arabis alpina TaxID=50452 RepID=A0A087GN40_ARAAL|nr:hypothetical protein AALP_AA6G093500 [Arabis alpina]